MDLLRSEVDIMSILPPNKPQKARRVPRNYFIYGDTMSGKSYLAERFPSPLFLNTDGNSEMNTAPSIQLKNVRKSDGSLKESVIDQLDKIILALGTEKHGYKTVVIDVVDDVVTLIEQAICYDNEVETLGDVPYGKGYAQFNTVFQAFVKGGFKLSFYGGLKLYDLGGLGIDRCQAI